MIPKTKCSLFLFLHSWPLLKIASNPLQKVETHRTRTNILIHLHPEDLLCPLSMRWRHQITSRVEQSQIKFYESLVLIDFYCFNHSSKSMRWRSAISGASWVAHRNYEDRQLPEKQNYSSSTTTNKHTKISFMQTCINSFKQLNNADIGREYTQRTEYFFFLVTFSLYIARKFREKQKPN